MTSRVTGTESRLERSIHVYTHVQTKEWMTPRADERGAFMPAHMYRLESGRHLPVANGDELPIGSD